jgi:hypothetical protein
MWENPKESLQMFKLSHANTWCVNRREAKIMWVGQYCNLVSLTLKSPSTKNTVLYLFSHMTLSLDELCFSSQRQSWSRVDILLRWGLVLFGWTSVHNNWYWITQNPYLIHEILLHDSTTGISCTQSVVRLLGCVFYEDTVNSEKHIIKILQMNQ